MSARVPFGHVGVEGAEDLIRRGNALLLDVRDAKSFGLAHIRDAQHVSSANLSVVINETPRRRPILIYCYHGNASQEYAQIFSDFGFSEVYSLDGGYQAWTERPRAAADALLDATLAQWLTKWGFAPSDLDGVIANGTTPLMKASHEGQGAIVRMLLAAGAQKDARNADGNNALWLACVGTHLDIVDMLIDSGIDVDNRNDNGATPLMYASSSGKAAFVARLLARGADPAPETLDGFTALDLAATVECLALLRRASRAGASPEKPRPAL